MLQIAIVDDHEVILDEIQKIVNQTLFETNVDYQIHRFNCVEALPKVQFDLMILDIELPGISGLEFSKRFTMGVQAPLIIFLTSYGGYMKDAFGMNVVAFLLKERFTQSLPASLLTAVHAIVSRPKRTFKTPSGLVSIFLYDLVYVEYCGRNPILYPLEGEAIRLSSTSLRSIHENIASPLFVFVNNHTILNLKHVHSVRGDVVRVVGHNEVFHLSRRRKKDFIKKHEAVLLEGKTL